MDWRGFRVRVITPPNKLYTRTVITQHQGVLNKEGYNTTQNKLYNFLVRSERFEGEKREER